MAISKMPQILRTYVLYCVHNIGIDLSHGRSGGTWTQILGDQIIFVIYKLFFLIKNFQFFRYFFYSK